MMSEGCFPVQDSVLSPQAIAERLLPGYGLTPPCSCRFFRKGPCDTYQIGSAEGLYYLKVYRVGRRSRLELTEKIRLLHHLLAHGVSVVRPAARLDGEYVNVIQAPEGLRPAVLFHAAEGEEERTEQHRRAFGAMVARMHAAGDRLDPPYGRRHLTMDVLLEDNLTEIERLLSHRPEDFRLIRAIADQAGARVKSLLPDCPPEYGACHGDLHGSDVRYDTNGQPTLFDFDSSGCGWRAVDIGVYLCHQWMDTSEKSEAIRQQRLAEFLAGYQTVRQLSANELTVIQITPAIRHIFLMGNVLRQATVHQGWNWANDNFIDWHLKWFRHWQGQKLAAV